MIPKNILFKDKKKSIVTKGLLGSAKRPRLTVFRSNRAIYAQLVDDMKGRTLTSVSDKELDKAAKKSLKPVDIGSEVGRLLAQKAVKIGITRAIFDRNKYKYHGRVKSIAEAARKNGLQI